MEIIVGEEADMKIAAQREMLHMFFLKSRCHNVWLMRGNHVMGPWLAIGVATLYMYSINTVPQNHNHRIQYHTIPKETHVGHRPLLTKPLLMAATRECSPPGVLPNIFIFLPKHPLYLAYYFLYTETFTTPIPAIDRWLAERSLKQWKVKRKYIRWIYPYIWLVERPVWKVWEVWDILEFWEAFERF